MKKVYCKQWYFLFVSGVEKVISEAIIESSMEQEEQNPEENKLSTDDRLVRFVLQSRQ